MGKLPQRFDGLVELLYRMLLNNVSLWTMQMKGDCFKTFKIISFYPGVSSMAIAT